MKLKTRAEKGSGKRFRWVVVLAVVVFGAVMTYIDFAQEKEIKPAPRQTEPAPGATPPPQ